MILPMILVRLLSVTLAIFFCTLSHGQQAIITVDVWPTGKMPGKGAREPEMNHSPERTDAIRMTHVSRPTLTVFPAPGKNSPTILVCPGGGYSYCVIDKEGSDIAAWLHAKGMGALVLKYRVPHNRSGAYQDIQRALCLARAHAAEWNIDPQRLGVIGFSAGGHLAARASHGFDERSYPAIDLVDQHSCRPDFTVLVYPAYLEDRKGGLSPDLNFRANIPPTLIVHSDDDQKFILGSKLYRMKLKEDQRPHKFLCYATGGHGYGLRCEREASQWPVDAIDWLESIVMPPPVRK
jgi:acetyl esterase/lipase